MRRRWHSVAYALVAATAACAVGFGCSLITSFDGYGGRDAAAVEASDPKCPKRNAIPERPARTSTKENSPYVGAAQVIDFVKTRKDSSVTGGVAYIPIEGFDLDDKCTVRDDPSTSPCAPAGAAVIPDQEGTGGDNGIGSLLAQVLPSGIFFQAQNDGGVEGFITDGIASARHGILVRLKNYNGFEDDDDVAVELFNVVGVNGKTDGTGTATFSGNDVFIADGTGIPQGLDVPPTTDPHGYVRDNVLVATFDEFAIQLRGPIGRDGGTVNVSVAVPLKRAYFIGAIKITDNGGLEIANATLTGRMPTDRLFTEVDNFGICALPNDPNDGVRGFVCQAADIPSGPDRKPTDRCDALSFAYRMTVKPAKFASGLAPRPPATPICTTKRLPCPQ